jgi:cell wall-associated NlpC family hydrolase
MGELPMLTAASMAANQAALSGAEAASMQQSTSNNGIHHGVLTSATSYSTNAKVNTVVSRAMAERGVPYSYGGGGGPQHGPSYGIDQGANTKGFDCSGLVQYAYWPYVHLPRTANLQMHVGTTILRSDIRPGDLIFSNFGEDGPGTGAGHVQMAIGHGPHARVVEAPHTGSDVRVSSIESGPVVVKRVLH